MTYLECGGLTPLCGEPVEKYFDEILNVTKAA